ncbi:hypothetical protein EJ03DRAFT_330694 [Teratosphaeria nubilosa]|uniref:Uncharacterized protein n=1 Tax=Teratosphaeria nubilosa TaxID=161662 RepID=A0A6G1L044_9PEZI|nr:hypothetical protein EJ03DRAFT_330694 [Teratosphaeria nubilosa]
MYGTLRLVSKTTRAEVDCFFWQQTTIQLSVIDTFDVRSPSLMAQAVGYSLPLPLVQKVELDYALHDGLHRNYGIWSGEWQAQHRGMILIHLDLHQENNTFRASKVPQELAIREEGFGREMNALEPAQSDLCEIVERMPRVQGISKELLKTIVNKVSIWEGFENQAWNPMSQLDGLYWTQAVAGGLVGN